MKALDDRRKDDIIGTVINRTNFVIVKREQQPWHIKREHLKPRRCERGRDHDEFLHSELTWMPSLRKKMPCHNFLIHLQAP